MLERLVIQVKKLIVNADDFGLTNGVNAGTVKAFKNGIVCSATLMVNGEAAEEAFELVKENPKLGVGIHLVLTFGRPISKKLKNIVDANGDFLKQSVLREREIDLEEVEVEFRAQIEQFTSNGITPTHIDSHHHVHMIEEIFPLVIKLANELGIPVRDSSEHDVKFLDGFYGNDLTVDSLVNLLESNKDKETVEIMVHPAEVDELLKGMSSYSAARENELEILTSDEIKKYLDINGIELINFTNI